MLTYDQTAEIRYAFEEAFIEAGRRRALRTRHRVDATIYRWKNGKVGEPINTTVEDFSAYGIGLAHPEPLDLGTHYLLKVPRRDQEDLQVLFTCVRKCQVDEKNYSLGLEASAILKPENGKNAEHLYTDRYLNTLLPKRVKLLFLAFGVLGLALALELGIM